MLGLTLRKIIFLFDSKRFSDLHFTWSQINANKGLPKVTQGRYTFSVMLGLSLTTVSCEEAFSHLQGKGACTGEPRNASKWIDRCDIT